MTLTNTSALLCADLLHTAVLVRGLDPNRQDYKQATARPRRRHHAGGEQGHGGDIVQVANKAMEETLCGWRTRPQRRHRAGGKQGHGGAIMQVANKATEETSCGWQTRPQRRHRAGGEQGHRGDIVRVANKAMEEPSCRWRTRPRRRHRVGGKQGHRGDIMRVANKATEETSCGWQTRPQRRHHAGGEQGHGGAMMFESRTQTDPSFSKGTTMMICPTWSMAEATSRAANRREWERPSDNIDLSLSAPTHCQDTLFMSLSMSMHWHHTLTSLSESTCWYYSFASMPAQSVSDPHFSFSTAIQCCHLACYK